jgi:hypothetical protein
LERLLQSLEKNLLLIGYRTAKREKFQTVENSHLRKFLEIQSKSETGVYLVSQMMPLVLKMLLSLTKLEDGHCLLIHKVRPISGSEAWKRKKDAKS